MLTNDIMSIIHLATYGTYFFFSKGFRAVTWGFC